MKRSDIPGKSLFILAFTFLLSACSSSYEVVTWNEWCDHEVSKGIAEKSRRVAVSYNHPKIREDFVKDYNEILVEEIVGSHFWDGSIHSNKEAEALIANHRLGFWVENNNLHFSNTHLTHEMFAKDVQRFKKFLHFDVLKDNTYELNNFQLCVFKTIDSMFENFIIHTSEETTTIPLTFSFRGYFQSSTDS